MASPPTAGPLIHHAVRDEATRRSSSAEVNPRVALPRGGVPMAGPQQISGRHNAGHSAASLCSSGLHGFIQPMPRPYPYKIETASDAWLAAKTSI